MRDLTYDQLDKILDVINRIINLKEYVDSGGSVIISNQGQGMDGYTELDHYRQLTSELQKLKGDK